MRLVPRQIESYKNDRMIDEVVINELPDVEMIYNIVSEKDKTKTVKTCERMIRSSLEYKEYLRFLKDYIEMVGDPYCSVKDYEGLLLIGKKIESGE